MQIKHVLMVVVACFCIALSCAVTRGKADRPNIVVILVDDLGYGDLSCYGATDLKSPAIDKLAAGGMRLTNAYANCPVCSPTRAALLSGRYPEEVGVPGVIRSHHPKGSWGWLSRDAILLPAVLKKAGYKTAIIGKWHLGCEEGQMPNDFGFDFFYGFLGDMMNDYYHHRRAGINYMRRDKEVIDPKGHATDLFTQWAIDYIAEHGKASNKQPFFLYLAYNAPHTPIQPPKDWVDKVKEREPEMNNTRAKLVALIEHMDAGIGKVLQAIEEARIAENTLVIFASDNGGQLNVGANNGNLRGGKQMMYEGGIRVPMIATWPGKIEAGSSTTQIAMSMDIFTTACEIAGATIQHEVDGVSLLPTLHGKQQKIERDLFWVRREGGAAYMGQSVYAVRRGPWKLLQNTAESPFELFNLEDDPLETKDLRGENRAKFNELAAALLAQMQRGGSVPWQRPTD